MPPSLPAARLAPLLRITRHWKPLAILGALFCIYALASVFLVPQVIKKYAAGYVRDQLQRELSLGEVQFNPFTLAVQITQMRLLEENGDPIGRVDYLLVDAEFSSLFTRSYTFKKIQLNAPRLNVIVDAQGRLNLDFGDPDAPEDTESAPLPAIRIGELQLNNGQIRVEDHTRPLLFTANFAPIQFTLKDFRTEPNYGNAFHFAGSSVAGEQFDWQGDFTVAPLGSAGKLQIAALQAGTLQNYLQDALPFRLLAGAVGVQGSYQLAVNENMDLKLDLSKIEIQNAQVAPLQGAAAWVSLANLQLADTEVSLRQRSVSVQKLRIDGADLDAWFDQDYNLNLLELLGPDEPSDAPWTSTVKDIELVNARVRVADRSIAPTAQFTLFPLELHVSNFSTAPGTTINLNTKLRINEQADFSANGTVDLDTLSSQLKVRLGNFALKDAQSYADAGTDLLINDGLLTAEGNAYYKGAAGNKNPQLKFTGNVDIANLSTQDKLENKDFIKWQSVQLKNLVFSQTPDVLEIEQVTARRPYGRVIIASDGTSNIQHVLRIQPEREASQSEKPSAKAPNTTSSMRTRVAKVIVVNGSANFTDNTVQPVFSTGMQGLNGAVTGLSSANNTRATVKLEGNVDNYAPVAITGEANFLAADTFSDIAMNFRNMELTTFNPYSGKFAGYSIARGKLATEIRYQIRDRKLDAQHHIVIDQLEFGAATDSKDAVPLPIKLAVALLKDRNGMIDLNLPVSGSIDDPQFKVGPIVWKAFVGLLTKIVTAPFAALGSLFGGGDELSYVDFAPGSAALSATETGKLSNLAKAMVQRPQLKLNIPLTVITDADANALNEAAYAQAVNGVLPNATAATDAQKLAALTTLYQRRMNAAPTFPSNSMPASPELIASRVALLESQLKPLFSISADDRNVLTRARADAVQAALLDNPELSAERVYLTARSNEATSPEGVVRMALLLE